MEGNVADEAYRMIEKDLDGLYCELKISERVLGKPLDRTIYTTLNRAKQAVKRKDYTAATELYWQTVDLARDCLVNRSTVEAFKSALENISKRLGDEGPCKEAFSDLLALRTRSILREIVIPEFTIGPPATLIDAMDFFKEASRDYGDSSIPVEQRGVSLVLKLAPNKNEVRLESTNNDPFAAKTRCEAPVIPHISARFITLYDAIRLVCDATGYRLDTRRGLVIITPQDDDAESMRVNKDTK